jgi:hypothetical protein
MPKIMIINDDMHNISQLLGSLEVTSYFCNK